MYRRQLDEPIPMLGDVSPRNAVKSKSGREKVVAWLKTLENHVAHMPPDAETNLVRRQGAAGPRLEDG
jgi:hypothetical protein